MTDLVQVMFHLLGSVHPTGGLCAPPPSNKSSVSLTREEGGGAAHIHTEISLVTGQGGGGGGEGGEGGCVHQHGLEATRTKEQLIRPAMESMFYQDHDTRSWWCS